jgi:DNA-binding Xre family transcriptional regulator
MTKRAINHKTNYTNLMFALKEILKKRGIKYLDLAQKMGMSESSIKRIMNASDGQLSKIEEICEFLGVTLFDLMELVQKEEVESYDLTKEQEKFFYNNPHYLDFFFLLYENSMPLSEIKEKFKLTKKSVGLYLKKLEQLGLLELHPYDEIKFLVKGSLSIGAGSILASQFSKRSLEHVTKYIVEGLGEDGNAKERRKKGLFQLMGYYMSVETSEELLKDLLKLLEDYSRRSQREERLYGKGNLPLYTFFTGLLPIKTYEEEIPNL